jgi:hypothetical protein
MGQECSLRSLKKILEWMKSRPAPMKLVSLAFAELIVLTTLLWYATFPSYQWESAPNYVQMYLLFIASDPAQAFFCINTGPTGNISWLIGLGYGFIAVEAFLSLAGKRRQTDYIITNWTYFAYLIPLALFTISFQNAAQHYDWYWNPVTNSLGYVDTWTHIVSSWLICALSLPFAVERYFGWDRKFFWLPPMMLMAVFSIGWELAENVVLIFRPGSFFNTPINSIQDIIFGALVGPLIALWIYGRLVMDTRS